MSDTPIARGTQKLHIWQQNLNCSLEGQLDLLYSLKANNYDIAALQEPHIDFLGCTRANPYWSIIYPKHQLKNPKKTRSVILLNHNISMNNWEDLSIESTDVTGVRIHGTFWAICVFNIYNDSENNSSLDVVGEFMSVTFLYHRSTLFPSPCVSWCSRRRKQLSMTLPSIHLLVPSRIHFPSIPT